MAEVGHILFDNRQLGIDVGLAGAFFLGFAVGSQCGDGLLSALYLLVNRGFYMSVGRGIAVEDVVDAGHVAVRVVGGHDRECVGHVDLERCRLLILVVGLHKGVHPGYGRESLVGAAIVECLHCSELHGLRLGHLLSADMAGKCCSQRCYETYHYGYLDALLGQSYLAALHKIPA